MFVICRICRSNGREKMKFLNDQTAHKQLIESAFSPKRKHETSHTTVLRATPVDSYVWLS